MSFHLPPERIPAPEHRSVDRIIADEIAQQESKCRDQIEKLRADYQSPTADVLEVEPRHKVPVFPEGDPAAMEVFALKAMVGSAQEVVATLQRLIPELREQQEAKRKAALSPTEALEERVADLERGRADDRAEIAALRARFAEHFGRGPTSPSSQRTASSVPPMVMATAQRGGGTVSAFFGDDPHVPPGGGGVRRVFP